MERDLNNILTEVLVFPYEQEVVDSLKEACSQYVEDITLEQFEECVLCLCLDVVANGLVESVNTHTNRRFPSRVYRALAGYVVGETLSAVEDDDKVIYTLALRNVMKVKTDDANGIISKCIDPSCFSTVEDYWEENIAIHSLSGEETISAILDKATWSETQLDINNVFDDIKTLAKYYCRMQFENKYDGKTVPDDMDIFLFAYSVANDMASQDWLFAPKKPVETLNNLGFDTTAMALSSIKSRVNSIQVSDGDSIEDTSVYRRYLFANDYQESGSHSVSAHDFAVAVFYELLYERLKSDYDE